MSASDAARMPERPADSSRPDLRRLIWVGPLIVAAAIVANVLFALLTTRLFGVSDEFPALTAGAIAMFTLFGVLGALIVFALVARFSRRPYALFRKIALVVLVVSLIPDLAMPWLPGPVPAGPIEVILLMITHVIAAAIVVWLLERLTPA